MEVNVKLHEYEKAKVDPVIISLLTSLETTDKAIQINSDTFCGQGHEIVTKRLLVFAKLSLRSHP